MAKDTDTIAAISTPTGEGGIGIVRISGPQAIAIANGLLRCTKKEENDYPRSRYLYHGFIKDQSDEIIDEVLISFMYAPNTYTREDVVEINCHGGVFATRAVLKAIMRAGARLAQPGEFTRRAFINGRIDLSKAEAVLSIINARSEKAVKTAARSLQGELYKQIETIRDRIIDTRAPLEALFDYPEEFAACQAERIEVHIDEDIRIIMRGLERLLKGVQSNRAYRDGVTVAILGKPNVGKSSLLNALIRQQKAIVHEIPGTTRDLIEGYMNLGGYPLRILDTAGFQGTENAVEREGIARSEAASAEAELIIVVLDGSQQWSETDERIVSLREKSQGLVIVINKRDLETKIDIMQLKEKYPDAGIVRTSALKEEGIEQLENAIERILDHKMGVSDESSALVSIRHEEIVSEALMIMTQLENDIGKTPLEIVSMELNAAWVKLGEIIGDTISDDLLDRIFSEFCLGK